MRFSDIPIRGVRVEVDHWVLGQFILERFEDEFGTEQILGVDPESYPGEYFVDVNVKNTTPEILEFSDKLEEELQEKGINVVIMSKSADGNIQPQQLLSLASSFDDLNQLSHALTECTNLLQQRGITL